MHHLGENGDLDINGRSGIKPRSGIERTGSGSGLSSSSSSNLGHHHHHHHNYNQSSRHRKMPTSIADLVEDTKKIQQSTPPPSTSIHDPTLRFVIEFTAGALGGAVSRTA